MQTFGSSLFLEIWETDMAEQDIQLEETTLTVWAERDRLHIALYMKSDEGLNDPLLDVWDEDARQLFEDGFLKAGWMKDEDRILKQSAFDYAKSIGRFDPANRVVREPVPVGWVLVHDELGVFMGWNAGPVYIWSSDADEDRLSKGAHAFGDETDAMDWFKVESDDPEELAENEEFMTHISTVEIELDVTLPGHTRPRNVSLQAMEQAGIATKRNGLAPSM
jgi:hypothetical protein